MKTTNKRTGKKNKVTIPLHLEEKLLQTIGTLGKKHYKSLFIEIKGVYVYVNEGQSPLCRLKYLGEEDDWGFAIFKYTSMTYSTNEIMFPQKGSMYDCIEEAVRAYSEII